MRKNKNVFTTGEAAKICNISSRSMSQWIDRGVIQGAYRIPSGRASRPGQRRIPRAMLLMFMRSMGIPVPSSLDSDGTILLVGATEQVVESFLLAGVAVKSVATAMDAGIGASSGSYGRAVVWSSGLGTSQAIEVAGKLREMGIIAVIAGSEGDDPHPLMVAWPWNATTIVEHLEGGALS